MSHNFSQTKVKNRCYMNIRKNDRRGRERDVDMGGNYRPGNHLSCEQFDNSLDPSSQKVYTITKLLDFVVDYKQRRRCLTDGNAARQLSP